MNKNWTLGLIDSAWFGTDYEGKRGREEAKRIGFESLDVFVGFDPGKLDQRERQAYIDDNLSTGLPVVSLVCTCLGLERLQSGDPLAIISSGRRMSSISPPIFRLTAISASCPANTCSRRSSSRPRANGTWSSMRHGKWAEHAATRRRELAIELLPFEFAFINSLDTMERFLDEVGLANVKATVDISHFWLMRIPPEQVARRLKGRIAHVHMSDCDGTNHGDMPPGRGNTPFGDYLEAIRETGFQSVPPRSSSNFRPIPRAWRPGSRKRMARRLRFSKQAQVHAS